MMTERNINSNTIQRMIKLDLKTISRADQMIFNHHTNGTIQKDSRATIDNVKYSIVR